MPIPFKFSAFLASVGLIFGSLTSGLASEFSASSDQRWACMFEFGNEYDAISRAKAVSSADGFRGVRYAEVRVFERQGGAFTVCAGQVKAAHCDGGRSAPIRCEDGADFKVKIWSSRAAQAIDVGPQPNDRNSQLGGLLKAFSAIGRYCANHPEDCERAHGGSSDRDVSHDIMENVICHERNIC